MLTLRKLIEQAQKLAFDKPNMLDQQVFIQNDQETQDFIDYGDRALVGSVVFDDVENGEEDSTVVVIMAR